MKCDIPLKVRKMCTSSEKNASKSGHKVILKDRPQRGPSNARVTIVEFLDFECLPCAKSQSVIKHIFETYDEKIRLVFMNFPKREIHPNAQEAAEAARCAFEQGKFWEYHDILFENQGDLGISSLKRYARKVGLGDKFDSLLESGRYKEYIEKDISEGISLGVNRVPTFFVNGAKVVGAKPFSLFKKMIDEELKNIGVMGK